MHHLNFSCPFMDPVLLRFGPLTVNWYGLMYCLGTAAWYLIAYHELTRRQRPIPVRALPELLFHGLLGAVIGARVGYVLVYNLPFFLESPWEIFALWHGGMSAHGFLVGATIGGFLFVRRHKVPLRELADICYLGLPVGLMLIKIGNFINCEGFGKPTALPWGVVFSAGGDLPRHPAQLYEAVLEGLLLFTILWRVRLRNLKSGDLTCFFFIGYGSLRFVTDFFRDPDHFSGLIPAWLTLGQVMSLCVIAVGALGYFLPRIAPRAGAEDSG